MLPILCNVINRTNQINPTRQKTNGHTGKHINRIVPTMSNESLEEFNQYMAKQSEQFLSNLLFHRS